MLCAYSNFHLNKKLKEYIRQEIKLIYPKVKFLSIMAITIISIVSACKKVNDKPSQTIIQSADTNRWSTIWQNESLHLLSISFVSKDTGYVVMFNDSTLTQSIMTTYNGGKTWINNISNLLADSVPFLYFNASYNKTLYVCSDSTLYKSVDAGINWKIIYKANFSNSNSISPLFLTLNNNYLFYSNYNGLFISKNAGETWDTLLFKKWNFNFIVASSPTTDINYFMLRDGNTLYLMKTTNGYHTWDSIGLVISDSNYGSYNLQFIDDKTGFLTPNFGHSFYRTNTAGFTWEKISSFNENIRIQGMYFMNKDTGYLHDDYKIYVTYNGGKTWAIDYLLKGQREFVILAGWSFVKTGEAFAITSGGRIIKKMY